MSTTITSNEVVHAYTYAWLGTAGKSASTLTRDGVELRRNLATNPGTEVDASGWNASSPQTTAYAWTGTPNASSSTQTVNGYVRRTNEIPNPAFNESTNGWTFANGITGSWDSVGKRAAASRQYDYVSFPTTFLYSDLITTRGGVTKSARVLITNPSSSAVKFCIELRSFSSSGAQLSSNVSAPVTIGAVRSATVTLTVALPANAASYRLYIQVAERAPFGDTYYFDQVLVETNSSVDTYFDGDTAGATDGVEVTRSTAGAHTGAASLRVRWLSSNTVSSSYVTFSVDGIQADTDYMVSFWLSIPANLRNPLRIRVADQSTLASTTVQAATSGWVRVVLPVHTAVGRSGFTIWLDTGTGYLSQLIYVDDLLVETGGAELPFFDGSTDSYAEVETTRPVLVLGWEESATGGNVVNDVVGGGVDVTLRPSSLRQGSFELLYEFEDDAAFAFAMHQKATTLTITDTDRSSVAMRYVVAPGGQITRRLDEQTRDLWAVRVPFQEVTG